MPITKEQIEILREFMIKLLNVKHFIFLDEVVIDSYCYNINEVGTIGKIVRYDTRKGKVLVKYIDEVWEQPEDIILCKAIVDRVSKNKAVVKYESINTRIGKHAPVDLMIALLG